MIIPNYDIFLSGLNSEFQEFRTLSHFCDYFTQSNKIEGAPKGVDKYVIRINDFTININSSGACIIILLGPSLKYTTQRRRRK